MVSKNHKRVGSQQQNQNENNNTETKINSGQ